MSPSPLHPVSFEISYVSKTRKKGARSLDENEQTYAKIGARLKALRKKKGYTSADKFAFENEIDRSQYGKYERGRDMQISTLLRILSIHNMTIEEFFGKGFGE